MSEEIHVINSVAGVTLWIYYVIISDDNLCCQLMHGVSEMGDIEIKYHGLSTEG